MITQVGNIQYHVDLPEAGCNQLPTARVLVQHKDLLTPLMPATGVLQPSLVTLTKMAYKTYVLALAHRPRDIKPSEVVGYLEQAAHLIDNLELKTQIIKESGSFALAGAQVEWERSFVPDSDTCNYAVTTRYQVNVWSNGEASVGSTTTLNTRLDDTQIPEIQYAKFAETYTA